MVKQLSRIRLEDHGPYNCIALKFALSEIKENLIKTGDLEVQKGAEERNVLPNISTLWTEFFNVFLFMAQHHVCHLHIQPQQKSYSTNSIHYLLSVYQHLSYAFT